MLSKASGLALGGGSGLANSIVGPNDINLMMQHPIDTHGFESRGDDGHIMINDSQ